MSGIAIMYIKYIENFRFAPVTCRTCGQSSVHTFSGVIWLIQLRWRAGLMVEALYTRFLKLISLLIIIREIIPLVAVVGKWDVQFKHVGFRKIYIFKFQRYKLAHTLNITLFLRIVTEIEELQGIEIELS